MPTTELSVTRLVVQAAARKQLTKACDDRMPGSLAKRAAPAGRMRFNPDATKITIVSICHAFLDEMVDYRGQDRGYLEPSAALGRTCCSGFEWLC